MTFIVTRQSTSDEARWVDVPPSEVREFIIRDLLESGCLDEIPDENREDAVRAVVGLDFPSLPPFPPTWEWFGNTYRIERAVDLDYPIELTPDDNETVLVTFPDISGAVTFGNNEVDALENAVDCLETMLLAFMLDRKEIPNPSPARGRPTVRPSLLGTLKVMLYQAMHDRGWRKADLARALEVNARQVDRLLDLRHASTVRQLEQALAVCGKRADVLPRALEAA